MKRFAPAGAAPLLLLASGPARAELVLFREGRVVKAAGYRVVGDELEIDAPGGGSYRVDLERVDRILDDEIEIAPPALPLPEGERVAYDLSYRMQRKPLFGSRFDALIEDEARRQNVDASLVSAVIRAESNFEPRSVSRKGARGLMQLMPGTARRLGVSKPFDPRANVRGGVRYLKELSARFDGRPELVLAAYNAGENAVETYGGIPPYRETVRYVEKILSWWTPAVFEPGAAPPAPAPAAVPSSK
jgi:Transglycosylase SLT domain